jgi:single-stranded DNA-binding protein
MQTETFLNSSLIEGHIVDDPRNETNSKGVTVSTFTIATRRWVKRDSRIDKDVSHIDIQAVGKLAEACKQTGRKDMYARVVGKLMQDRVIGENGTEELLPRLYIEAEHIEFRSDFKSENKKEN